MKCVRCGKVFDKPVDVCDICSFNFKEYAILNKYLDLGPKPEDMSDSKGDLVDRPILAFVFGLLGLILIGTFIFSIFAVRISKKPAKSSLKHIRMVGIIMGYIGIVISAFIDIILLYLLILGLFA